MKRLFQAPSIDWPYKYQSKSNVVTHPLLKNFYQPEIVDGNTPIGDIEFIAMDFETTGLDSDKDDIITIGIVPFTLNRIYLNRAKHWIVRPRQKLDENSVVIHGITHSDIIDAPDLSEIMEEVLAELSGKIVVVHYRHIERDFLDKALKLRIGEGIEFPVVDTMEIESLIQKRTTSGLWNKLKGKKPESVRLGQSRTRYGLPAYTPHHALMDAVATAELFQAQIAHHYNPQISIRTLWR
ncbi:DNA polymerase-3 subunit epsilon [Vibrio diazotrophicus]|jgi:DNA polymerase-3 subunit epsilon|uniref:DNA-directed DNA polymerase n=1 Tax=Vibrio diazotrophicus TaxID=685 RepID=A0A2J8GJZ6_VIBDI|nr:3'-5' exonuclease [Vibrio diazotrophicus]PNH86358.1 DNA polymerase III subunit epsilon [Vibrio diazotrophicus]RAS59305.1 DNA polymerase-3 subunit epsilon [Vibrio diazotrophicus]